MVTPGGQRERAEEAVPATARSGRTRSCVGGAGAGSVTTPSAVTMWLSVCSMCGAESAGPSEMNRPPIDQLEITANAARKKGAGRPRGCSGAAA